MTTESMRVYVSAEEIAEARAVIRYNADASVCMVWRDGEPLRCPTQRDMDTLPVGADMSDDEVAQLD